MLALVEERKQLVAFLIPPTISITDADDLAGDSLDRDFSNEPVILEICAVQLIEVVGNFWVLFSAVASGCWATFTLKKYSQSL